MFGAERAFFNDDDPNPYSMFVRVLESHEDRANGMGQETSYLSWIGPRTTFARRLKVNIAHEMFHRISRNSGASSSTDSDTRGATRLAATRSR